jgi:hypothetical protein
MKETILILALVGFMAPSVAMAQAAASVTAGIRISTEDSKPAQPHPDAAVPAGQAAEDQAADALLSQVLRQVLAGQTMTPDGDNAILTWKRLLKVIVPRSPATVKALNDFVAESRRRAAEQQAAGQMVTARELSIFADEASDMLPDDRKASSSATAAGTAPAPLADSWRIDAAPPAEQRADARQSNDAPGAPVPPDVRRNEAAPVSPDAQRDQAAQAAPVSRDVQRDQAAQAAPVSPDVQRDQAAPAAPVSPDVQRGQAAPAAPVSRDVQRDQAAPAAKPQAPAAEPNEAGASVKMASRDAATIPGPSVAAAGAPAAVPPSPAALRPAPEQSALAATALSRGDAMLAMKNVGAARSLYEYAANAGNARAAVALAETYDPVFLNRLGVIGPKPDPALAAEWYRKAAALGDRNAVARLQTLRADAAK